MMSYLWRASSMSSTYGPTKAQLQSFSNAVQMYDDMTLTLKEIEDAIGPLRGRLEGIGAPKIKE